MSTPADGLPEEQPDQRDERVRLDLLEFIGRHSIDDDYAAVAARRAADPEPGRRAALAAAVALALFGLLALTAAVQTNRNAVADDQNRARLISQIQDRQQILDERRRRATRLTAENARLQQEFLTGDRSRTGVFGRLRRLSLVTGASAVTGPGVRVTVDDAPGSTSDRTTVLDNDLQRLANGLWAAGAEGMAINGIRLTSRAAIRTAAGAITVDYVSLSRPYVVTAIGNPETLPARFAATSSGASWYDLQRQVGLRFRIETQDSLTIPASEGQPLRYATRTQTEADGGRR